MFPGDCDRLSSKAGESVGGDRPAALSPLWRFEKQIVRVKSQDRSLPYFFLKESCRYLFPVEFEEASNRGIFEKKKRYFLRLAMDSVEYGNSAYEYTGR